MARWDVADFVVVRTPALAVDVLLALGEDLDATGPTADGAAADRDRRRVSERLVAIARRGDVDEALRLASPALGRALDAWRDDPTADGADKVTRSVLRYVARMASRATPFGLLAGWSMGTTGGTTTRIDLTPASGYRRRTGIDYGWLGELVRTLESDPAVRERLVLEPNSSLHEAAGRLRYVESQAAARHLAVVEPDPVLRRVVAEAAAGGRRRADLVRAIREVDDAVDLDEALAFVDELLDQQMLVSTLGPTVTGADPLDALAGATEEVGAWSVADTLRTVRRLLTELDAVPPGGGPAAHDRVVAALARLPHAGDPTHAVRTNLVVPADVALGSAVVGDLAEGVELLCRIGGTTATDPLRDFRTAFLDRYGERAVPLAEALDEECGVGFPPGTGGPRGVAHADPALDGLNAGRPGAGSVTPFTPRDEVLARLLWRAARARAPVIDLGPAEIADLEAAQGEAADVPDAVAVMASVIAGSPDDVDAGRYRIHLAGVAGPSGATLLGRFCADDDALTEHVRAHLRAEEALWPDVVLAEVVHLPNPRSGNVVARPLLRRYEIPYLGRSGAPREAQIPIGDLWVSVAGRRVVLTSERLGREIVPRLTSAHDFRGPRNLGLYRFLGALQGQGATTALTFSPGALAGLPHLPRVTSGRLIMSRARWTLTPAELRPLLTAEPGGLAAARALRADRGLPRWVGIAGAGGVLPVDLESALFVDVAVGVLRARPRGRGATLVELFLGPDELLARSPEGRFTHELVVPFVRAGAPVGSAAPSAGTPVARGVRRRFPPGSEWLYAKLYTGSVGDDVVLREVVRPTVAHALASGAADRWFFVRYGDPDWHVRLRIHGAGARLLAEVAPALVENVRAHLESGLVWRVQLDTYEREVERYGGPDGIEAAERVFHADSEAALELLGDGEEDAGDDGDDGARWRLALVGADRLLTDAGLDLDARYLLVRAARERFLPELDGDGALRRRLGVTYRQERAGLDRLLALESGEGAVFTRRSAVVRPLLGDLRRSLDDDRFAAVVGSLLHMQANRMLGRDARRQELVVYDALTRTYQSRRARAVGDACRRRSPEV